ncbi:MAG: acetone carboxylase subunit gamma, partial [Chloroflexota bacterium]
CTDGGGCGKYAGGAGSYRIYMIYGSKDLSVDYKPYGGVPEGAFGLFGGYPSGTGGVRALYKCPDIMVRLSAGDYPTTTDELEASWGQVVVPKGGPTRIPLPEFSLVADFVSGGGGYGDPLERDPHKVVQELRDGLVSGHAAINYYGIALLQDGRTLDAPATQRRRQALRQERLAQGRPFGGSTSLVPQGQALRPRLKFHEYLEIAGDSGHPIIRCRCGHVFCSANESYKDYALRRVRDLEELTGRRLPHGQPYLTVWLEYICPGCATLLQVDVWCPSLGDEKPLWDTRLDLSTLSGASQRKGA